MPTVVRSAELLPEERRMLGVNIEFADIAGNEDDESELAAVNRSLAAHGEAVAEWPTVESHGVALGPCSEATKTKMLTSPSRPW